MSNGLSVNDITPLGERPADVWRGRTGTLGAGVFTITGSPIFGIPADGNVLVYDAALDEFIWLDPSSLLGNDFVTRTLGGQDRVTITAASGAAVTIDCSTGNAFDITLTANCTLTITNPPPSSDTDGNHQIGQIVVALRQGGTGSYTVTWPASVVWAAANGTATGSAPTLFTTVGAQDNVILTTIDGGATWGATHLSAGNAGTVTSVALTVPAEFSIAGSPVTTAGTLAITKATESSNTVWAGPSSGAAAQPTFRALTAADIPSGVGTTDHEHINNLWFSGDGATTAFELPAAPFDSQSVRVWVSGTLTDVTLSGTLLTTMTFGSAPASATNNIVVDLIAAAA